MPEVTNQGGAQTNPNPVGDQNTETTQTKTVAWEDHQRALNDMHKFKTQASTLETKYNELANELQTIKQKGLEGSGDFKTLYEQEKVARAEVEGRLNNFKQNVMYSEKYKAAQTALVKAGLKTDALKILDREALEEIKVEATSEGRFIPHGIDLYVENFKKNFPFAFDTPKAPSFNGGGGANQTVDDGEELTADYLYKLEKTDKKKYMELLPKYLERRKQAQLKK